MAAATEGLQMEVATGENFNARGMEEQGRGAEGDEDEEMSDHGGGASGGGSPNFAAGGALSGVDPNSAGTSSGGPSGGSPNFVALRALPTSHPNDNSVTKLIPGLPCILPDPPSMLGPMMQTRDLPRYETSLVTCTGGDETRFHRFIDARRNGGSDHGIHMRRARAGNPPEPSQSNMMVDVSSKLPDHLIETVLSRLPVQTFFRFRSVCKYWCSLLDSQTFLKAWADAGLRHNVWFLVVTANLGRIVATYDPESNVWHHIPLPPPLCDLNPYPTAADGGLVCYFVYENRTRTLFVCNPLTKSLRKLPMVLKSSSHISVLKMVTEDRSTSSYKVFVAGMVPGENGADSLSMEVYDSVTDSWSSSGIIPARYPKRRPVYANGVLYVRCYDQRSLLLTFDMRVGVWSRIHATLPNALGYEELVQYQGHVLLVGLLEDSYRIENVFIWELQQTEGGAVVWKQVDAMPRDLFQEFFHDREYYECLDNERVVMKCCQYGDLILCVAFNISHRGPFKVLAYDLGLKLWHRLPESFRARECRTHKFIEGVIYEPRLDAVA